MPLVVFFYASQLSWDYTAVGDSSKSCSFWGNFKSPPKHSSCHAAVEVLGAGQHGRQTSRKAAGSWALPQWGEMHGQAVTQVNVDAMTVHHF